MGRYISMQQHITLTTVCILLLSTTTTNFLWTRLYMGCDSMKPGIAELQATVASACCHHSIFVLEKRRECHFTFNNLSQETTQKLLPQSLSFRTFCSCHHVVGIRLDLLQPSAQEGFSYNCCCSVVYQYWSNISTFEHNQPSHGIKRFPKLSYQPHAGYIQYFLQLSYQPGPSIGYSFKLLFFPLLLITMNGKPLLDRQAIKGLTLRV